MAAKTYIIIDLANLLARAKFSTRGDVWTALGLALHITLQSIKYSVKKYNADHVVFAYEGRSWRKEFDEKYKKNRLARFADMSATERETDETFNLAFRDFEKFIKEKTNCTVLHNSVCEADDMIAGWIQTHPDDKHIIISSDSDFQQLINDNVMLYDGVNRRTYLPSGIYDEKDRPVINKKTKLPETVDPEYMLFEKIIRGDSSDNVFAAFPGVREPKIKEAYADRHNKGYAYNNFMLSRWTDKDGNEHVVRDRYNHNKTLIDLTAQPEIIRDGINQTILNVYEEAKDLSNIGFAFLKFCGKYELKSLAAESTDLVEIFRKKLV